jgi:hypothetical protein
MKEILGIFWDYDNHPDSLLIEELDTLVKKTKNDIIKEYNLYIEQNIDKNLKETFQKKGIRHINIENTKKKENYGYNHNRRYLGVCF